MEWIRQGVDLFLHLDTHLNAVMQTYGVWTYAILFVIIFSETGFVVTPFLPGDSLLFAAGALAATAGSPLRVEWLAGVLTAAAILGNTLNYSVGRLFGDELSARFPRVIKPRYLEKTHAFYEKYGGQTIIITRFVPIVRTFAPFVAGVGHMRYLRFSVYNAAGGLLWVGLLLFSGYWFGGLKFVKEHFAVVELAIIVISVLPIVIEFLRARRVTAKVVATPRDSESSQSTTIGVANELERLSELAHDGLLTPDEWLRAKELFLGKPADKRDNVFNALQRLHELHKSGALSQSEFNLKKWDILSRKDL